MRTYIRHPSDIPIEVVTDPAPEDRERTLNDVSFGGLSFSSKRWIPHDTVLVLRIPLIMPSFEVRSRVVWCRRDGDMHRIGVTFLEREDIFLVRMVEQICHIEHYKNEVIRKEGRTLTGQQAALEWIKRYATDFPRQ
jgi:hypothetical protein